MKFVPFGIVTTLSIDRINGERQAGKQINVMPPCSEQKTHLDKIADGRKVVAHDVSMGSHRPEELARKLLISDRLRNVAAPRPVFFNSSWNIRNSFSLSRLVRRSLIYVEKSGVMSTSVRFTFCKYLDSEVEQGQRWYGYRNVAFRVVSQCLGV